MSLADLLKNRGLVYVAVVALTGGCINLDPQLDPTRFYVLPEPTSIDSEGTLRTLKVGLLSIEVPGYLKSSKMVIRKGESELTYSEYNRWAEDLDQGIGRVLQANLANRLPEVEFSRFPWPDRTELDYRVKIRFSGFEGDRNGGVALQAEWSLSSEDGEVVDTGNFHFEGSWNGTRYEKLVGELRVGLARLSGEIGLAISDAVGPGE